MTDAGPCPHCGHEWSRHPGRCDCGCMWQVPVITLPVPPPTEHQLLVARVREAIFDELDRQHDAEPQEIDGAGYWNREEWGTLDGEPDWTKVAAAAVAAMELASTHETGP